MEIQYYPWGFLKHTITVMKKAYQLEYLILPLWAVMDEPTPEVSGLNEMI